MWICDNRSASGKGAESAWTAYKRLGESELADIEDGLAWLKKQPWVDGARIGLNGWSYGGFMTAYALTHSTSFAMGIAGGSVTDWRNYDSIYTERYMLLPEHNADGLRAHGAAPRREEPAAASCCSFTARWTTTCTCRTPCSSSTSCRRPGSRSS